MITGKKRNKVKWVFCADLPEFAMLVLTERVALQKGCAISIASWRKIYN